MNDRLESLLSSVLQLPLSAIVDDLAMAKVETWDSLRHMEVIAGIEETFGVSLTFDEIVAMQTVGEIRRILGAKGVEF